MKDRQKIIKICLLLLVPLLLFCGCSGSKQDETSSSGNTVSDSQISTSQTDDIIASAEDTSVAEGVAADSQSFTSQLTDSATLVNESTVAGNSIQNTERMNATTKSSTAQSQATTKSAPVQNQTTTQQQTTAKPATTQKSTTTVPTTASQTDGSVSIVIQCNEAVAYIEAHNVKGYENIVPQDGIMLNQSNVTIQKDDTVLDVLKRVTKDKGIVLIVSSGGYVSNIGGLVAKAKAFGQESGWLYSVNGVFPSIGAAQYKVKDGDKIELKFVTKRTDF